MAPCGRSQTPYPLVILVPRFFGRPVLVKYDPVHSKLQLMRTLSGVGVVEVKTNSLNRWARGCENIIEQRDPVPPSSMDPSLFKKQKTAQWRSKRAIPVATQKPKAQQNLKRDVQSVQKHHSCKPDAPTIFLPVPFPVISLAQSIRRLAKCFLCCPYAVIFLN